MAVDTQNKAADIHTKGMNAERFVMLRTMQPVPRSLRQQFS